MSDMRLSMQRVAGAVRIGRLHPWNEKVEVVKYLLLPRSPSMGCARAYSAAYLLEDEVSTLVASRVCIVQALETGDRKMPEAGLHRVSRDN